MENTIKKILGGAITFALLLSANSNVFAQDGNNARAYPPEQIKAIADLQQKAKANYDVIKDQDKLYRSITETAVTAGVAAASAYFLKKNINLVKEVKSRVNQHTVELNAEIRAYRELAFEGLTDAQYAYKNIFKNIPVPLSGDITSLYSDLGKIHPDIYGYKSGLMTHPAAPTTLDEIIANPEYLEILENYPERLIKVCRHGCVPDYKFEPIIGKMRIIGDVGEQVKMMKFANLQIKGLGPATKIFVILISAEIISIVTTVSAGIKSNNIIRKQKQLSERNIFDVSPQYIMDDETGQLRARLELMARPNFVEIYKNATIDELKKEIEKIQKEEKQNQQRKQKQKEQSELLKTKYVPMFNNYMPEAFKA